MWGTLHMRASTLSWLYKWAEPWAPGKGRRAGLCSTTGMEVRKPEYPRPHAPQELGILGDSQASVKGLHKRNQSSESRWMGLRESPRSGHTAHLLFLRSGCEQSSRHLCPPTPGGNGRRSPAARICSEENPITLDPFRRPDPPRPVQAPSLHLVCRSPGGWQAPLPGRLLHPCLRARCHSFSLNKQLLCCTPIPGAFSSWPLRGARAGLEAEREGGGGGIESQTLEEAD